MHIRRLASDISDINVMTNWSKANHELIKYRSVRFVLHSLVCPSMYIIEALAKLSDAKVQVIWNDRIDVPMGLARLNPPISYVWSEGGTYEVLFALSLQGHKAS